VTSLDESLTSNLQMTLSPPDPSNLDFERRMLVREDVGRAF
jgi:hypothetical protein